MDVLAFDIIAAWSHWVWPILQFAIGLCLVVFVHELGHFVAAKWAGIKVERFALGFGPTLVRFQRGETEYALKVMPLGGYLKMLGQDDFNPLTQEQADPRSWQAAPVGKRLVVLSAGVGMNVVFAAVMFVLIYTVGIRFTAPIVGAVEPGYPAAQAKLPTEVAGAMPAGKSAGLAPGDRILAINGRKARRWGQILLAAITSDEGEQFDFRLLRRIDGKDVTFNVTMTPERRDHPTFGTMYVFGIGKPPSTVIEEPAKAGPFQRNDRIVEVGGTPIESFWDIQAPLADAAGQDLEIVVLRNAQRTPVKVKPPQMLNKNPDQKETLTILGMSPRVRVARPPHRSPAADAGMQMGDVILDYAGRGPPSRAELLDLNEEYAGKEAAIRVLRQGQVLDLTITPKTVDGEALIGIIAEPDYDTLVVANVAEGSPAAEAGIPEGASIDKVNEKPVANWSQLFAALRAGAGGKATIAYTHEGKAQTVKIGAIAEAQVDPERYLFDVSELGVLSLVMTDPIRGHPGQALLWSGEDTWMWLVTAYKTLRNLATGRTSHKGLSGPVGITVLGVAIARKSFIDLAYFMAMLSAVVAFFNFLPLPVLDGGHVVLVLIEKVRGRPLPTKTMAAIQIAGLVLIGGIFLFITWNDISRWILQ